MQSNLQYHNVLSKRKQYIILILIKSRYNDIGFTISLGTMTYVLLIYHQQSRLSHIYNKYYTKRYIQSHNYTANKETS